MQIPNAEIFECQEAPLAGSSAAAPAPTDARPTCSGLPYPGVYPRIEVSTTAYDNFKRVMDFIGAALLLLVLLPLMLMIAVAVAATSPGPVIYRQERLGLGGRVFTIFKFRSMRRDAEAATGPVWAAASDSRVTHLGKVLRATRLDELPQLWNVVLGDMSLIGPRPERPEIAWDLEKTLRSFRKRLLVKPGISGLSQVSVGYAACAESYRRKVAMDLLYIKRRSFLLDLQIALRTIIVVLTGSGSR